MNIKQGIWLIIVLVATCTNALATYIALTSLWATCVSTAIGAAVVAGIITFAWGAIILFMARKEAKQ